jgi:hypothetical protein
MLESLNIQCTNFHEFSTAASRVVDLVVDRKYSSLRAKHMQPRSIEPRIPQLNRRARKRKV